MSHRIRTTLLSAGVSLAAVFASIDPSLGQSVTIGGDVAPSPAVTPDWDIQDSLIIGNTGTGTLRIEAGGTVSSRDGTIGAAAGSTGTATVTGARSTWTNDSELYVGNGGSGTLRIEAGGMVSRSRGSFVGYQPNSTGVAMVTGTGSSWDNRGDLHVGYEGSGTLRVEAGGAVSNGGGFIGGNFGSSGTVTVTDPDSTWSNVGSLVIGLEGSGTLTVGAGGRVTVTDGGEPMSNDDRLVIGLEGSGTLTVGAGGAVNNGSGFIGVFPNSTGMVTVTGSGSSWNNSERLVVGTEGNGTLRVEEGGAVRSAGGAIGVNGGSLATVTVKGSGSTWTNSGPLQVGDSGAGMLRIEAGGVVSTEEVNVNGNNSGVTVTGPGSNWAIDRFLAVGGRSGGTLTVEAAGAVRSAMGFLGVNSGSGMVTVSGSGSNWTIGNFLAVGYSDSGTLNVEAGGLVSVGNGDVVLALIEDSTGTLNVGASDGAAPTAAGTLAAGRVSFGASADPFGSISQPVGTGTIVFNHTGLPGRGGAPLVFAPVIRSELAARPGTIEHRAGVTSLTGVNTAADSFLGAANVTGGTLLVDGVFGDLDPGTPNRARIDVSGTGILGGSGAFAGSVAVNTGGTLAPGNSIGTLTVAGDVTFGTGSTFAVEAKANGEADRVDVGGTATLTGGRVLVTALDPGVSYVDGRRYAILEAGTRAGEFVGATMANASAFLTPSLEYGTRTATLVLNTIAQPVPPVPPVPPTPPQPEPPVVTPVPPAAPLFQSVAVTPNQFATAGALNTLAQSGESLSLFNAILFSSADNARLAFDQLSGELHASTRGVLVEGSRYARHAVSSRVEDLFSVVAQGSDLAVGEDRFLSSGAWIDGFGSFGRAKGDGNAARADRDVGGMFAGIDRVVAPNAVLGLFGGYGRTDVAARGGSAEIDTIHAGAYGAAAYGAAEINLGATYAWNEVATARNVAFPRFTDNLAASYDAGTTQVFGEAGYRAELDGIGVKPFVFLAYVHLEVDGFAERGGAARLTSSGGSSDTLFATLGLRANTDIAVGGRLVSLRGMAGWRNARGDTGPTVTNAFVTGLPFTVRGAPQSHDAALLEAGFSTEIAPNVSFNADYVGRLGEDTTDNGFRVGLSARF